MNSFLTHSMKNINEDEIRTALRIYMVIMGAVNWMGLPSTRTAMAI